MLSCRPSELHKLRFIVTDRFGFVEPQYIVEGVCVTLRRSGERQPCSSRFMEVPALGCACLSCIWLRETLNHFPESPESPWCVLDQGYTSILCHFADKLTPVF